MAAIYVVISICCLIWLVRPWGRDALGALVSHPPLGPYAATWWWEDGLLRFARAAWRALLTIQTVFLGVLVTADLRTAKPDELSSRWAGNLGAVLSMVLLFLLIGLVAGAALQIWRISQGPTWAFGSRTRTRCFAPVVPLTVLLFLGWGALLS